MSSDGVWEICCKCGEPMWMRTIQREILLRNHATFYCMWGHPQAYSEGETEEAKLRRERDRLKQQAARLVEEAHEARQREQAAERRASAARGQVTKLKKRAMNGVCPCCNRTFSDLARHMAAKHAGFLVEEVQSAMGAVH